MFSRKTFTLLLVGSLGVPFIATNHQAALSWVKGFQGSAATEADSPQNFGVGHAPAANGPAWGGAAANSSGAAVRAPANGQPAASRSSAAIAEQHLLQEVLQWNVTPGWVLSRWPRVSVGLSELDMQGYRVPLVTGTSEGDLAGSLTYYFDERQQLVRICFNGTTGDSRPLVGFLASQHRFEREYLDDASLYVYRVRSWGKVKSELLIKPSAVVRSNEPRKRFDVALLMERPS